MTSCPKCGSLELQVHGTRCHVGFVRRWWLFGRIAQRIRPVAVNVSCGSCFYAFIIRPSGVTDAPEQKVHDALMSLQRLAAPVTTSAKANGEGQPQPAERKSPRLAPDPRVKRR